MITICVVGNYCGIHEQITDNVHTQYLWRKTCTGDVECCCYMYCCVHVYMHMYFKNAQHTCCMYIVRVTRLVKHTGYGNLKHKQNLLCAFTTCWHTEHSKKKGCFNNPFCYLSCTFSFLAITTHHTPLLHVVERTFYTYIGIASDVHVGMAVKKLGCTHLHTQQQRTAKRLFRGTVRLSVSQQGVAINL